MKKFLQPIINSWRGVFSHKLRSFLTILGIVIGIASVIALMAVGRGATAAVIARVQGMGANLITIRPYFVQQQGVRQNTATTLTFEDALAIQDQVPNIAALSPIIQGNYQVVYGGQNMRVGFQGITTAYQQIVELEVTSGSFFTQYDYDHSIKAAVLGANVYSTLFNGTEAIGQTIRAGNYTLVVAGVLKAKGASMTGGIDDGILVPYTALAQMGGQRRTANGDRIVNSIAISTADQKYTSQVESDITSLLAFRHGVTSENLDFNLQSMEDILSSLNQITAYLSLMLGSIAGISLLVGGIGVMNIMLVSVIERTREIGIRKALGARESDIWGQFLMEAIFLTFIGGIFGITLGWIGATIISRLAMTAIVSPDIIILAVSVSVGIGLFFGFYPAWQASRLNPIEALRHE